MINSPLLRMTASPGFNIVFNIFISLFSCSIFSIKFERCRCQSPKSCHHHQLHRKKNLNLLNNISSQHSNVMQLRMNALLQ